MVPYGEAGAGEANWDLSARVEKHSLGWGDDLLVHVYFSGYGIPQWAKLSFYPPLGLFLKRGQSSEDDCISVTSSISTGMPQGIAEEAIPEGTPLVAIKDVHEILVTQHGADMKVPIAHFFPLLTSANPRGSRRPEDSEVDRGYRTVGEVDITEISSEGVIVRHQPFLIRAQIPFWAAAGTYSIPFTLSYSTAGRVKSSTYRLDFQIRSFWEKAWFQASVLGSAVVAGGIALAEWLGWVRF
ncbi:MAG TPA: hypothetical protein VFG07_07325 [Thermoplasmata archaeon]|nr:hypothetical protein [Thermoplasmata archaeon]